MESRRKAKDPDYEPPLDKVCGVIYMLETDEEVRRFIEAYFVTPVPGLEGSGQRN